MRRVGLAVALLLLTLLSFGMVADRVLEAQAASARLAAQARAASQGALLAGSVQSALLALEQTVLAQHPEPGVETHRLAMPPPVEARRLPDRSYAARSRSELLALLGSRRSTASGLPEAVIARLLLGPTGSVSTAEGTVPDVGELLLAGALPVRAEDVPVLAHALGIEDTARVRALGERLHTAPDAGLLPDAPVFRRTLRDPGTIEGWSVDHGMRVGYRAPVALVLQRTGKEVAHVADRDTPIDQRVAVPDVPGLALVAMSDTREERRLQALRLALWAAVVASAAAVLVVRRAVAREARATARERRFLASVTHELRTPVAAMRALGETLAEGRGSPREYGALMAEESQRLEDLVEKVLAATRLDEAPHFADVEPAALLRSATALLSARAERRDVLLRCEVTDLPSARWDGDGVRRAIANLVDNAIRHGRPGGTVDLGASLDGESVRLSVSDDGPGIVARERPGLFGRFRRGESGTSGTGLGLYLVDQVARAHGGRVDLDTGEGRGCTFTLVLPRLPPAARDASP